MPVFVDTNVIVYANSEGERSPLGEACLRIMHGLASGRMEGRTSVAVLEETWHLELRGRPSGLDGTTMDAYLLFTPLLAVTDAILRDALTIDANSLGSNDRVHVATCAANGIDAILSADQAFDGVPGLRRIDPLDREALAALSTAQT